MIRPVCGVVLFVVLLIAVLDHAQGCGRKKQTEDCNPTLWDATRRTCHDELFVKRDVANIAEEAVQQQKTRILQLAHISNEGRVKRQDDLPSHVYRVIRDDENPSQGLEAKDPNKNYKPSFHICRGSTYPSQYISTTADLDVALNYAAATNNRVVSINLRVARNAGIQIGDYRDGGDLTFSMARNFARSSQEILLWGGVIPRNAIQIVYNPNC